MSQNNKKQIVYYYNVLKHCSGIFVFLAFFILVKDILATLTINEIYPVPAASEFEWVELYNSGSDSADLTQYLLTDLANNKIKITDQNVLANDYYVASCSSVLNNSGDTVYLKTQDGELIDIATYSGTFTSNLSFARCKNDDWLTTNIITKSFSNEMACFFPTGTTTPSQTPTETVVISQTQTPAPTETPTPVSYDNIFLSEIYPCPDSGENEWVEIYNGNDFSVILIDWYFDDDEGSGSSPKKFSMTIKAKNYAAFDLTSSMFNNTGDGVRLLDFDKNLKDSFEYVDCEKEKSWGRTSFDNDEFCQQEPSKDTENTGCIDDIISTSTPVVTIAKSQKPTVDKQLQIPNKQSLGTAYQLPITSIPEVKGVMSNNTSTSQNNKNSLSKTFSFIAFSNSLLTISSILLKIKIHEAICLFS